MTEGYTHHPRADSRDAGAEMVFIADRDDSFRRGVLRVLRADGFEVASASDGRGLDRALADPGLAVLVLDPELRGAEPLRELLGDLLAERSALQVILVPREASVERAVESMRCGAFDVLPRPERDVEALRRSVRAAIERARWARSARDRDAASAEDAFPELVGHSPAMRRLARTIQSLRHSESHVLVLGESGTGKELVARAIHGVSPRAAASFVPVDCGALPESVIESELFGHEKGSFTGALGSTGLFRMAEAGTLFLDEIGEVPVAVQAKLLRALQYKEVRPVGGGRPVPVDLRVITATHRDLAAMVDLGRFRTDLYYRLNVIRIEIPPLRERPEDIPLLVHHFLEKYAAPGAAAREIDDEALSVLVHHDWPGNVRELENAIESALVFAPGEALRAADIPIARGRRSPTLVNPGPQLPLSLDAYERSALERALRESGGNATEAARRLGIGRSTFYRKLNKLGAALSDSDSGGVAQSERHGAGPGEAIG